VGLFTSSKDNPEPEPKTEEDENYEDNYELVEIAEVRKPVTKEAEYTEHRAEVHYMDGTKEEIVFDEMARDSEAIILSSYVDYTKKSTHHGCGHPSERTTHGGFQAEKFATIPTENLKKFHTVKRTDRTWEYEDRELETKKREEVEDDEEIVETWTNEVKK